jgi:4-hydroxymandelate oxidase
MSGAWLDSLEEQARAVLSPAVHEYFRQGAGDGVTAAEAVAAWRRFRLASRVLRSTRDIAMGTTVLGTRLAAPVAVAPSTLQRAADPRGELAMAEACANAGSLLVLSSNATASFKEVAATGVAWWLQAYLPQERELARPMLDAAVDAGARAVVLTVDTPVVATKYATATGSVWEEVPPDWLRVNLGAAADAPKALDLGPTDIRWLWQTTGLPVVVKGVLRADDVRGCVAAGASAVWVSNHGGRQLDRSVATADALSAVAAAVTGQVEVYVDGGLRSGLDVLVALALGAKVCFLGRLPLYALAVDGEDGVRRMFAELQDALEEALRLAGCPDVAATRGLVTDRD